MSKITPTTKTCNEICRLITGYGCDHYHKYVQTTFDPVSTHALYGVAKNEVDYCKDKIKNIGGKYLRVVKNRHSDYVVICFALEITPQELAKKKMEEDAKRKFEQALESKIEEVKSSIILHEFGATNESALNKFANYLINGTLDPLLPFESYVILEKPTNKDEQRIYDIVNKANRDQIGCVGMVTNSLWKMTDLARQMNHKISGEDKRLRRKAACLKYGLKFLAKCFECAA